MNTFPYLKIVSTLQDVEQLKYFDLTENDFYYLQIRMYTDEENFEIISSVDPALKVVSYDNNITILDNEKVILKEEGSVTITAFYTNGLSAPGIKVFGQEEFVVYDSFFRENYLSIISEYDKNNIISNTYLKILFTTIMEFFDIIYAYTKDTKNIRDGINIKYKFLNVLGVSLGFGTQKEYDEHDESEIVSVRLFRELLNNLFELLEIRGTALAYEIFFGALGYDIKLLEYWYNKDGDLIEIKPNDDTNSTFYAITTSGVPIDDVPYAHEDPRRNTSPKNKYNYCKKSNYIKPTFSYKEGFEGIISYSNEQRLLLREYLEWLRPNHIQYLNEIINILIPDSETSDDILPLLYEKSDPITFVNLTRPYNYHDNIGDLITDIRPYRIYNINNTNARLNYNYIDNYIDPAGNERVPDPGRLDYSGVPEHGTWQESGGGFVVEDLLPINEVFIVSYPIEFNDILKTLPKYDSNVYYDGYVFNSNTGQLEPTQPLNTDVPPEQWNNEAWIGEDTFGRPSGNNFAYDAGIMLDENTPQLININNFQVQYDEYFNLGYASTKIKTLMIELYNITENQYNYLLSL